MGFTFVARRAGMRQASKGDQAEGEQAQDIGACGTKGRPDGEFTRALADGKGNDAIVRRTTEAHPFDDFTRVAFNSLLRSDSPCSWVSSITTLS